jgi:subtilisin family serine protease
VVNLSFGPGTQGDEPPAVLGIVLRELAERGTALVAAAGNDGTSRKLWPGADEHVVAIAAARRDGEGWGRAAWSNHGDWVDALANGADLEAPFVEWHGLPTAFADGGARWSGTSFAAPQVAGRIARAMTQARVGARDAWAELARAAEQRPQDPGPPVPLIV